MDDGKHEIQVSGIEMFSAEEWKDAIEYYLDGIRTDNEAVTYRPKIFFGGVTLRRGYDHYTVNDVIGNPDDVVPEFSGPAVLCITSENDSVDDGLHRLATNEELRMLVISFADGAVLRLWKKEDGTYGAHAMDAGSLLPH